MDKLVVFDTNVFGELIKEDERIVRKFFEKICEKSFVSVTVLEEYLKENEKNINKLSKDIKSININFQKKVKYIEKEIEKMIKDIENFAEEQLDKKSIEELKSLLKVFEELKIKFIKVLISSKNMNTYIDDFNVEFFHLLDELEKMFFYLLDTLEKVKENLDYKGKIITHKNKVNDTKNKIDNAILNINYLAEENRVFWNYMSFIEYLDACKKTKKLSEFEIEKIKEYCKNTKEIYYGKDDYEKEESVRYNDQIILNEIENFALEEDSDVLFITNDWKELGNGALDITKKNFKNKTNKNIEIMRLKDFELYCEIKEIEKLIRDKEKNEDKVKNEFLNLDAYIILDEIKNYVEENINDFIKCIKKDEILSEEIKDYVDYEDEYEITDYLTSAIEDNINIDEDNIEHKFDNIDLKYYCYVNKDDNNYIYCEYLIAKIPISENFCINANYKVNYDDKNKMEFYIDSAEIDCASQERIECFVKDEIKNSFIINNISSLIAIFKKYLK